MDDVAASPIELALGGLLVVVLGLIALVWGAAFSSSWLIMGERPDLGIGDAAVAMARLGRNDLTWEGAWSPSVEPTLAGPWWFWLAFAIESAILALLFWPLWRVLGPNPSDPMAIVIEEGTEKHPRKAKREAERAARSVSRGVPAVVAAVGPPPLAPDTGKILVDAPSAGRLVLGRVGDDLVATEKHHSVLALGPTGSGKTSGLALPGVLEWRGPALVVTAKADLVTLAWSERTRGSGESWLFDPTGSIGTIPGASRRPASGNSWSPLQVIRAVPRPRNQPELDRRVRQWALARRSAHWMVSGVRTARSSFDIPSPWYGVAEQMLAPLLLAAAAEELSIGQVVEWVDRRDEASVGDALARTGVAEAAAAWDGAHQYDRATTVGSYQILVSVLHPFGDPTLKSQAKGSPISAGRLLDGKPNTLFILSPAHHQDRLRPLLTSIISEMIDAAMNQAATSPRGRLDEPLLVVVDDAVGCAPIELVEQLASVGAGLGIQLLTLSQDLTQLGRISGQRGVTDLADSHRARVVLPGITDPFTLDYLNALIRGNRLVEPGRPGPLDPQDEVIVSTTASWMRTLDDGAAILVYGNLAPIRMTLRPWYGDRALVQRLEPPSPEERTSWWRRLRRRSDDLSGGGFPNPFDSAANDREAERYWESVRVDGILPNPLEYDDGSSSGRVAEGPIR